MKVFNLIFFGFLCLVSNLDAQYFSAPDGITVNRLGKRTYSLYNLLGIKLPGLSSSSSSSAQLDNDNSVNQDDFRQLDKLSTIRKFYKQYGKRIKKYDDDDEDVSSEEGFQPINHHRLQFPKNLFRKHYYTK
ncbi:unnamed protein product [Brachionus calyciflorus]|uniref:Uncharacterized protein n=1 Tax=Brachionus calyciflorus TaxID=104777 RepID=A0A814D5P0_9BILA|nr:unnamed protein product [Brachionus calyciflorus]